MEALPELHRGRPGVMQARRRRSRFLRAAAYIDEGESWRPAGIAPGPRKDINAEPLLTGTAYKCALKEQKGGIHAMGSSGFWGAAD